MKYLSLFILSAVLFVGLTFAGKAIFGMDDGMMMGSIECVNHCIDATVIPSVMPSALPVLLFVLFSIAFIVARIDWSQSFDADTVNYRRLTEPIRVFVLSQHVSTIILRE